MELTPRRVCNLLLSLLLAPCVLPWAARAANNPVPLINTPLNPASIAPGGAGFTLTVNGTGFVSTSVAQWNGSVLTTHFVSGSQLTATVPASDIASAGSAWVTVTNPAPGGGTSLPAFLRIATPMTSPSFVSYSQNTIFDHFGILELLTGDFNGDRKLDLAFIADTATSPSTDSYSLCIELGNGDGSFQTPVCQPFGSGQFPTQFVAGDFNGDGKLDLAVANDGSGANTVFVYLGNGDGTLQQQVNSPAGSGPVALATGDFNRDGKLDLVVANVVQAQVNTTFISVLLGNGDGTFQSPVTYASGLNASSLAVGDFNGDGNLDIGLSDSENGTSPGIIYFLAGNGDGTFQAPHQAQTVSEFATISAAADFNGDGKLDLLLTDETVPSNSILVGNGDGTFQPPVNYPFGINTDGSVCRTGVVDDLNADGKLDLAFCQGNAGVADVVAFQLGNGDSTFQPVTNITASTQFPIPGVIVTGDFTGDGRVDIVTGMFDGPPNASLLVYLQGSFPVASATPSGLTFPPQALGTSSTPQTVTLANTGTIAVTLSGVAIGGTNAASFAQTNTCGATLAGGATCQINVTFTPTTPGNPVATVSISDSSVGSPQTVFLVGSTLGPGTSLSPSSVTFPSQYVGTSGLPQSVTLTNTGTATLSITKVAASPSDFGSLNACGSSLAAGASCAVGVFFDPTTSGTRTGTLTITDNAAGSPQTVTLTGIGEDFSVNPGAASSATVSPGQSASYTVGVAPIGGFAQSVALSCSGGPAQSTCAVSPSTIALSGTTAKTATVSVTTMAGAQAPLLPFATDWPTRFWQTPQILAWIGMFLLIAVALSRWRQELRFRWTHAFALALLVCLGMTLTSCGGGSSSGGGGGGGGGTQAGTYTITVTGDFTSGSTNLTHTTKLTLVVQ
jgi:hypothetical protein